MSTIKTEGLVCQMIGAKFLFPYLNAEDLLGGQRFTKARFFNHPGFTLFSEILTDLLKLP